MTELNKIRNFSIIAHVDHGKSTLADRILEITKTVSSRQMREQFLDKMDIERERGITIKAQSVRITYQDKTGQTYILNLIDTPGHVDFSYEVSRSLAACEGALLVVDATQGVEAQTLANVYLAIENNLEVIPVLNKVDLPSAESERVKKEIEDVIGLDTKDALLVSAKTGLGVVDVLEAIVQQVPPPEGDPGKPLQALIFDSWFDPYQGTVVMIRVVNGIITKGLKIMMMANQITYEVDRVGVFTPEPVDVAFLGPGEVGFITAGIKQVRDTKIGDTLTDEKLPATSPLPGFKPVKPMVFSGLYPVDTAQYDLLKEAVEKLWLNDPAFSYEVESSTALGFGFRCGFLGLLHMEIVQERLEREFGLSLISTAPSVPVKILHKNGEEIILYNPSQMPKTDQISLISEPYVKMEVYTPKEYLGGIITLCEEKRGIQKDMRFISENKAVLTYDLPFNEIVMDFYDRLKSISRGYASIDYEFQDYKPSELVKMDILINKQPVDALSLIIHKDKAYYKGKDIAEKLRKEIPRQMFEVVIQAAIGNKIIAKERIAPLRKDVLAKCYGGDVTRKRKLLEKQKEGKKRMKQLGQVEVPQEAFLSILKS